MPIVIKGSSSGQITVDVPNASGDNTISLPASTGTVALTSDVGALKLLHVRDEKSALTHGGSSSSGDNTRDLNTVITNEITGASLASNQITLPAGTYFVDAHAPAFICNRHRGFIYNVTDSAELLLGHNAYARDDDQIISLGTVHGRFTLSAQKVIEFRHYVERAQAQNGLGVKSTDSRTAIYAQVFIRKVS